MNIVRVLSFWKFAPQTNDQLFTLKNFICKSFNELQVKGRIYIAEEGINAQLTVPAKNLFRFYRIVKNNDYLKDIRLNFEHKLRYEEPRKAAFTKLKVNRKKKVINDGDHNIIPTNFENKEIPPAEWHDLLTKINEQQESNSIILDCRNHYEQILGHFKGSVPVDVSTYRDSFHFLEQMRDDLAKKDNILIYCTGGIRCAKITTFLEDNLQLSNIKALKGGIISYANYINTNNLSSEYRGKNFVFDNRLEAKVVEDGADKEFQHECVKCGSPGAIQNNCANDCCNEIHFFCEACNNLEKITCSVECQEYFNFDDEIKAVLKQRSSQEIKAKQPGTFDFRKEKRAVYLSILEQVVSTQKRAYATYSVSNPEIESYILSVSRKFHPLVYQVESNTKLLFPTLAHNLCGPIVGQYLYHMVKLTSAKKILELGCFTGYSTIIMASALSSGGTILTCEKVPKLAEVAQDHITLYQQTASSSLNINLYVGEANNYMHDLSARNEKFDIIFVDADKKSYLHYYNFVLDNQLLTDGGCIIFDNVFFRGKVFASNTTTYIDNIGQILGEFITHVTTDKRTEHHVLPLSDGILVTYLK